MDAYSNSSTRDLVDVGAFELLDRDPEAPLASHVVVPVQSMPSPHKDRETNIVNFAGPDDPLNPQNKPAWLKWTYATLLGAMTFVVTFSSSVFSTATAATAIEFSVSQEVMTLGTALFVLGFATGPVVFGPLSELYGRKIPFFIGYTIFFVFQVPVGVAQNLQTIFVCRFFAGVGASAPPAIVGGYLADLFDPVKRGLAVAVFAAASFLGPIFSPVLGGFITQSYLGWRWTVWITMIMAAFVGSIGLWVLPETYVPVILHREARRLRYATGNWALHAKVDEQPVDLRAILVRYLGRPFVMMALEPTLILFNLYISLVYGIIYLLFESYPISFYEERGYNLGVSALPFIPIGVGVILGSGIVAWYTQTSMKANFARDGRINPEDRLVPMIIGAAFLPIGCFWYAWTSSPNINPWPQILAGVPIGAGLQIVFLQGLAYIIDVYLINANSALSSNVIVRSLVGAGFVMFAAPMYHSLGVGQASFSIFRETKRSFRIGQVGNQFTGFSCNSIPSSTSPILRLWC